MILKRVVKVIKLLSLQISYRKIEICKSQYGRKAIPKCGFVLMEFKSHLPVLPLVGNMVIYDEH